MLAPLFPDIVTSRSESRKRDDDKVDLMNTDEGENGKLPFAFQCKTECKKTDYKTHLEATGNKHGMPVILERMTKKKGLKFLVEGKFAHMKLEDFLKLISCVDMEKLKLKLKEKDDRLEGLSGGDAPEV